MVWMSPIFPLSFHEESLFCLLFIDWFYVYGYTVAVFMDTKRGHQIPSQMVVNHHVVLSVCFLLCFVKIQCIQVCTCVWRPEVDVRCLFKPCALIQAFSLSLQLATGPRLPSLRTPGVCASQPCRHVLGLSVCCWAQPVGGAPCLCAQVLLLECRAP